MWRFFTQALTEFAFGLLVAAFGLLYFFNAEQKGSKNRTEPTQPQTDEDSSVVDRGINTDVTISVDSEMDDGEDRHESTAFRIPLGVPLRYTKGRCRLTRKTVLQGAVWSDSGYESYAASREILAPSRAECKANTVRELFGCTGGTLAVAGCFVYIPPNALSRDDEIEMQCHFDGPMPQDSNFMAMTPTVELTPSGLKFQRPITIVLPSYYDAIDPENAVDVKIQFKQGEDDWALCKVVKHNLEKKIIFQVDHFTRFRGIFEKICCHLLKKQLYYAAFVKRYRLQETPTRHALWWCICENLPQTVQQMTTEMGEHYERIVESETVDIRYGQHVSIEFIPQQHIDLIPTNHTFVNDDLWPQGSVRKKLFHLYRAENENDDYVTVHFKIKMKGTDEDSFSQQREVAGYLHWTQPLPPDPTHITIIRNCNIDNVVANT